MRGRWELSDAQWELIEPLLRPKPRTDGRGRPWQDASRAQRNPVGVGYWGTVARIAQEISAVPDLPSPLPAVGAERKLEGILRVLAEELHARGKLQLEEAFIDASFTGAKKGASRWGPPSAAKGRKSSLSPMITVFLSPLVSKALRRMS